MNSSKADPPSQKNFRTLLHRRIAPAAVRSDGLSGVALTRVLPPNHLSVRWLSFLSLLLLAALPASLARAGEPGEELTISVITIDPGDLVFEKFGHNGILVHDEYSQPPWRDVVYHWGNFDFRQKSFYLNYALGRMDYAMDLGALDEQLDYYRSLDRRVTKQELNLTPAQRLKLRDALVLNVQPENATYRYNYYTDNCSTRVRDAIDAAVGGQLKSQLTPIPTKATFRWHTRRLTRDDLFWYTALHTVLGPKTDRRINAWEECFLPLKMRDWLRNVMVTDPTTGASVPLVKSESELSPSTRPPEPTAPPRWAIPFFLLGVVIAAVLFGLHRLGVRHRTGRVAFCVAATIYAAVLGICSLVGLWFWLLSDHWAAWRNENLFGYSPLAVVLAFLLPLLFRKSPRVKKLAAGLAVAIAASTLIGFVLMPFLPQDNLEPLLLVLPINFALAWTVRRATRVAAAPVAA
jgi:hypothetical protein